MILFDELMTTIRECLWLSYPKRNPWEGLIYLIPLLLFWLKKDPGVKRILMIYLLVWPVYITMAVAMNRFANMRNLIFQQQFTLLTILLTIYYLGREAIRKMNGHQRWINLFLAVPALSMIIYSIRFFESNVDFALYGVSTRHHNQDIIHRIRQLPTGSTMAMPNWAISWYYIAKGEGYPATTISTGTEQVLVMHYLDKPGTIPNYTLIKEYTFYYLFVKNGADSAIIKPLME